MIVKAMGRKLTAADFEAVRTAANLELPAPLVTFLIGQNGGKPSRTRFKTQDGKVEGHVASFLPLDDGADDTLIEELDSMTLAGWLPSHIVSIAKTSSDNRIVISCSGNDLGAVYYWAWDEQDEDDDPSYDFMRLIADTFDDFIAALT